MTIPIKYRKSPEFVVTYDWTDVSSGLGIIDFRGFQTNITRDVNDYFLGSIDLYSEEVEALGVNTASAVLIPTLNLDFDASPFNTPRTIKGTAIINFGGGIITGGAEDKNWRFIVSIKKGTSHIASGATTTRTSTSNFAHVENISLAIPQTRFKEGETLRLTIEGDANSEGSDNVKNVIGCDPQNRDGTYITPSSDTTHITKLNFHCPFKIEI